MTTSTDIKSTPSLAIVVPCYNEQEAFPFCLEKLSNVLNSLIARNKINNNSYLLFVDDGSRDNTWAQIKDASTAYHYVRGGNDSNLLIVFYVQIMPDDFVMQLHRF